MGWRQWLHRLRRARRPWWLAERIEVSDEGVRVVGIDDGAVVFACSWHAIERVVRFERDRWTTPLICLHLTAGGATGEANEEMEGWPALVDRLGRELPGFPPPSHWRAKVALPAFATDVAVLFERA